MADKANNVFFTGRNAANDADLSLMRIDAADNTEIKTEDNNSSSESAQSRQIVIQTGAALQQRESDGGCQTGPVHIQSGNAQNSCSGNITLQSGESNYQSGDVFVRSGNGYTAEGWSGNTYIQTGGVADEAGECGDVILAAGQNQSDASKSGKVIAQSPFRLMLASSDPAGGEQGDMYFNTSSNKVKVYDGSQWKTLQFE